MKRTNAIGDDKGQVNLEENMGMEVDFSELKGVLEDLENKYREVDQKSKELMPRSNLKRKAFEKEVMKKYASMDKEALLQKMATFSWVMSGIKTALDILRPLSNMLLGDSKLSQAFNLLSEAVKTYDEEQQRTHVQLW